MSFNSEQRICLNSLSKLKATFQQLRHQTINQCGEVFNDLHMLYHQSLNNDKQAITRNQNTITELKKSLHIQNMQTQRIKAVISGQTNQQDKGFEEQRVVKKVPQNEYMFSERQPDDNQSSFRKQKVIRKKQPEVKQKNELLAKKKRLNNDQRNIIQKRKNTKKPPQQNKVNSRRLESYEQQSEQRDISSQSCSESEQEESVSKSQYEEESLKSSQYQQKQEKNKKNPLQSSSVHPLFKISYIPNITKLNVVVFEFKLMEIFGQAQIQKLGKFNLDGVSAATISTKEMNDYMFTMFTKLQWKNLKALRIDYNNITDIRPLKNLNLTILQDLDVSFNFLQIRSAQFLATESFESLIYLTISFVSGKDEQCWQILLTNQMDNYPKLQELDIGNSPYLSSKMKKRIQTCMFRKMVEQRRNQLKRLKEETQKSDLMMERKIKQSKYPENYKIKIRWMNTKQAYENFTSQQIQKINKDWVQQVHYTGNKLKRLHLGIRKGKNTIKKPNLPANFNSEQKNQPQDHKEVENKTKPIKKSRISVKNKKNKIEQKKRTKFIKRQNK